MKTKILFVLLFVTTIAMAGIAGKAGEIDALDLYWITFGGDRETDSVFLMQINQNGVVTRNPKVVLTAGSIGSVPGAAALNKGPAGTLNLWRLGAEVRLFRAVIRASTMNRTSLSRLSLIGSDEDVLQATQKPTRNFLAMETGNKSLKAIGVKANGIPNGQQYQLIPDAPLLNDEASLAADGRAIVSIRSEDPDVLPDDLFVQLLTPTGRPSGNPKLVATFNDLESLDITSQLPNGNRLLLFMEITSNQIFLQALNPNGNKTGSRKLINASATRNEDEHIIAVDPLGRFAVFTVGGNQFGCSDSDVLVYQKLTPTGARQGGLKLLATCGLVEDDIVNVDILRN